MTYDNTNRGFIRKNDRKENDKQPDYTGLVNVNGEDYWFSGWKANHENMGGDYLQIKVKKKDFTPAKEAAKPVEKASDSNIPF